MTTEKNLFFCLYYFNQKHYTMEEIFQKTRNVKSIELSI